MKLGAGSAGARRMTTPSDALSTQPPDPGLDVSIVIPTRDRAARACKTVAALAAQRHPADRFEVIVVANACADATAAAIGRLATPFALRLLELPEAGVGRARNAGAALARAPLLWFLDDDVEPLPGALAARLAAHAAQADLAVVGPLAAAPRPAGDLLGERLRALDAAAAAFHQARGAALDWSCVLGGNLSLPAALLRRVGGFDTTLTGYGGEDYELGCRLQQAGARFALLPEAGGVHEPAGLSLAAYLRRARSLGGNDVAIAGRHPQALAVLPLGRLARPRRRLGRLARRLAFDHRRLGDAGAAALAGVAALLAALRWRRPWNGLIDGLYEYWYYRGVADRLGSQAAAIAWVGSLSEPPHTGTGSRRPQGR